jgi:hypothetical protein
MLARTHVWRFWSFVGWLVAGVTGRSRLVFDTENEIATIFEKTENSQRERCGVYITAVVKGSPAANVSARGGPLSVFTTCFVRATAKRICMAIDRTFFLPSAKNQ